MSRPNSYRSSYNGNGAFTERECIIIKPSITLDLYGHVYHEMLGEAAKIMDEQVAPIKVELPSNEILDDKLHQSAPEKTNLPGRQVRKE